MSIRTRYLSQDEVDRLLRENPCLKDDPTLFCPTCQTKGYYQWRGEKHECDCQMQLQLYKHYLSSGIGVTYQRLGWVDFQGNKKTLEVVADYLDEHDKYVQRGVGLLLTGSYGTGKTMLTNLALKDLVKKGYTCYATTFASTIDYFTAGWYDSTERQFFRRKFINSEILLLDDFGRELKTSNNLSSSTFDNILRQRIQGGRPTFLTTNMDVDELEEGYGAAVLSLLRESSIVCQIEGEDFRPKASSRTLDEIRRGEVRPIV